MALTAETVNKKPEVKPEVKPQVAVKKGKVTRVSKAVEATKEEPVPKEVNTHEIVKDEYGHLSVKKIR